MKTHRPLILPLIAAMFLVVHYAHSQQGAITGEVPKCSTDGQYPGWSNSEGRYTCTTLTTGISQLLMAQGQAGTDSIANNTSLFTYPHNYLSTGALWNSSESTRGFRMPYAGTIDRLVVTTETTNPATQTVTIMVRKNGADTTLTLTISPNTAAGSFTDNTHSFTVAQGDRIAIKGTNSTGGSASAVFDLLSVRYTATVP